MCYMAALKRQLNSYVQVSFCDKHPPVRCYLALKIRRLCFAFRPRSSRDHAQLITVVLVRSIVTVSFSIASLLTEDAAAISATKFLFRARSSFTVLFVRAIGAVPFFVTAKPHPQTGDVPVVRPASELFWWTSRRSFRTNRLILIRAVGAVVVKVARMSIRYALTALATELSRSAGRTLAAFFIRSILAVAISIASVLTLDTISVPASKFCLRTCSLYAVPLV